MEMWVVLWTELGVRPCDVDTMTLDDALVVEVYAVEAKRRQARQRAEASRRGSKLPRRRR